MGVPPRQTDTKGSPVSCPVMWTVYMEMRMAYGRMGGEEQFRTWCFRDQGRGPPWWLVGLILEVFDVSRAF